MKPELVQNLLFDADMPPPRTWFQSFKYQIRKKRRGLPLGLLILFFLNAWMQSFPLNALQSWLIYDVKMSVSTQYDFYIIEFMPVQLKLIYTGICNFFPLFGYRYRSWLFLTSCCSAACYLITAFFVTTSGGAFAICFARAMFNSFSELMLSFSMIEFATSDPTNIGKVQAAAFSARSLGSVMASLIALAMYPCSSSSSPTSNRLVIAITAMFPLITASICVILPEKRRGSSTTCCSPRTTIDDDDDDDCDDDDDGNHLIDSDYDSDDNDNNNDTDTDNIIFISSFADYGTVEAEKEEIEERAQEGEVEPNDTDDKSLTKASNPLKRVPWSVVVLLQLVLAWVALQSLVEKDYYDVWWKVLVTLLCLLPIVLVGSAMLFGWRAHDDVWAMFTAAKWMYTGSPLLVIFLLSYNATPSAAVALSNYKYKVFADKPCMIQWTYVFANMSSLVGGLLYGWLLNARSTVKVVFCTTLLAGLTQLLILQYLNYTESLTSKIDVAFGWDVFAEIVSGISGEIAFVSVLVLITDHCGDHSSLLYAVYLSVLDLGDTLGSITSKYVGQAIDTTFTNGTIVDHPIALKEYVYVGAAGTAASSLLILLMVAKQIWSTSNNDTSTKSTMRTRSKVLSKRPSVSDGVPRRLSISDGVAQRLSISDGGAQRQSISDGVAISSSIQRA